MDIQQLTDIQFFYHQFLMQIRYAQISRRFRNDNERKAELVEWLIDGRKRKTFPDGCRHEILYMREEIQRNSLVELEAKIATIEENCNRIRVNMETDLPALD